MNLDEIPKKIRELIEKSARQSKLESDEIFLEGTRKLLRAINTPQIYHFNDNAELERFVRELIDASEHVQEVIEVYVGNETAPRYVAF